MEMDNDETLIFANKLLLSHRIDRLDESLLILGVCPYKVVRTKIFKKIIKEINQFIFNGWNS